MKTVKCVYIKRRNVLEEQDLSNERKYSFNIDGSFNIGDIIKTDKYDSYLKIVELSTELSKYVSIKTGETFTSAPENLNGIFQITEIHLLPQRVHIGKVLQK